MEANRGEVQQGHHPFLQLIDEEEWFHLHGLLAAESLHHETEGEKETKRRVHAESDYQEKAHERFFRDWDAEATQQERTKEQILEEWKDETILLATTAVAEGAASKNTKNPSSVLCHENLKFLASQSDTIFAMATHRHFYNRNEASKQTLKVSLLEYSTESVESFLGALKKDTERILPDHVIDCCRLAHYLQCSKLLDSIVDDYLMPSIDNENCRYLCQLADELSIPRLWEASINHMLCSLDSLEEAGNKDGLSLWDDWSPSLKREAQALRGILRSSNKKQVYFSTYHEYLGLLAEQHQYYKERLEDAKDGVKAQSKREQALRGELEGLYDEVEQNGLFSYRNRRLEGRIQDLERQLEGLVRSKDYATAKIQKQSLRVNTLKALWTEQKKIFGGGGDDHTSPRVISRKFVNHTSKSG